MDDAPIHITRIDFQVNLSRKRLVTGSGNQVRGPRLVRGRQKEKSEGAPASSRK
jgi:hypothetical protein